MEVSRVEYEAHPPVLHCTQKPLNVDAQLLQREVFARVVVNIEKSSIIDSSRGRFLNITIMNIISSSIHSFI